MLKRVAVTVPPLHTDPEDILSEHDSLCAKNAFQSWTEAKNESVSLVCFVPKFLLIVSMD